MELPSHVLAAISLQYNKEMFVRTHILSLFDISWHSNAKGAVVPSAFECLWIE
jgi:hypothetical protein